MLICADMCPVRQVLFGVVRQGRGFGKTFDFAAAESHYVGGKCRVFLAKQNFRESGEKMNKKTNVLWLMCDQLRYHALSCNGDPNIRTPNIDRLAAEGVRFTNAYSNYPVCIPFRAGLVTGQYPTTCGVPVHGDMLHYDKRTIAHAFREAGYRTSYVGKWHLAGEHGLHSVPGGGWKGEDYWVHPDLRGGFEDWYGFNLSNNYYRTFYSHGDQVVPCELKGYQTDGLTDLSLKYLSEYDSDRPWFHVLSVEAPHTGVGGNSKYGDHPVPAEYEEMFRPEDMVVRDNVPEDRRDAARRKLCGYYAMTANLDYNIGRVLKWLDESGQAENTLVVFFSDHGDMLASQGLAEKMVPYDESIHIPLIMRLPGTLPAASVCDDLVSGVDIYPTCAGLCGVPVDVGVQGIDLARTERAEVYIQWVGRSRFGWGDHPYRGIRTKRHTYVAGRDEKFCMLFDNEADEFQMKNLLGDPRCAELQRDLHARLVRKVLDAGEELPDFVRNRAP